jgi:hypothetical protein
MIEKVPEPTAERRDDVKGQADKFLDMARELGCDEDEAAFEDNVRKVVASPQSLEPNKKS